MGKILFWAVIIIGVLFVTRLLAHQAAKGRDKPKEGKAPARPAPLSKSEEMIRCANCGVYMPRSEAIKQDGQFWCSPEHVQVKAKH